MSDCLKIAEVYADFSGKDLPELVRDHMATCKSCESLYRLLDDALTTPAESRTVRPSSRQRSALRPKAGRVPSISTLRQVPRRLLSVEIPGDHATCVQQLREVEHWESMLNSIPAESRWTPEQIFESAEPEQVASLCEALGLPTRPLMSASAVAAAIRQFGGYSIANVWRAWVRERRVGSVGIDYQEVVRDVAKRESVSFEPREPISAIEERIIRNRFIHYMEQLTPEQQRETVERISEAMEQYGRSFHREVAAGGVLAIAEASGFGVYVLASTVVGSISHSLGLGLTFGFYVAMSKAIAVALPAGLAGISGWTLYKIGKPNEQKSTAAVLHIAAMRIYLVDLLAQELRLLEQRRKRLMHEIGHGSPKEKQGHRDPWWKRWFT